MNKRCLAIITARGGSKRIPRKNIKPFLGEPIIKYSIKSALKAGCFDEVMVSTDDDEIAEVAMTAGASVPFKRSKLNANDYATTVDVLIEVIQSYKTVGREFDYFCCIYPTAPFVTAEKLIKAFELLKKSDAKSVLPIVRFSFPIQRSFKVDDGKVMMNWPEHMDTRSQDLPAAFHDSGQFYFVKTEDFLKDRKLFTDHTLPIEMPESEVQDIDNEEDWRIAEMKYRILSEKRSSI